VISKSGHQPHIGQPDITNRLTLDFIGDNIVGDPARP
jgi:hypothetical protein